MPTPVKVCDSANKVMLRLMTVGTRNGLEDVLAAWFTGAKSSRREGPNNRQCWPISPAFFASSRLRKEYLSGFSSQGFSWDRYEIAPMPSPAGGRYRREAMVSTRDSAAAATIRSKAMKELKANRLRIGRRDIMVGGSTLAAASAFGALPSPVIAQPENSQTNARGYPFERGYPTKDGAQRARDDADFQRAVAAYRFWYPTVSCEGIFNGGRVAGVRDKEAVMIMAAGPRQVFFTANSDTPYAGGVVDVTDGPVVIEIPPGSFIGLVDDHHQSWVMDLGLPGPAADKGGKHLVLPPGYHGQAPAGYFSAASSSNKNMLGVRALPVNGDIKGAMDALRTVKIYPLATAADPKPLGFVDVTDKSIDATCLRWEDNIQYWQKLHEVLSAEPLTEKYLPMYGELAAIGIERGKPFAPDARMKSILERSAKAGRDQLLVSAFASDRADRFAWPDRKWEWVGLVPDTTEFVTNSGFDLEARDRWFVQAIVTSPAMFKRSVGAGSLYWLGTRDAKGDYVDGGKTYKLTVPLPVPANLFWSVTIYDTATRSEIQTAQDKAALRSLFELKDTGDTKSVDLFFGPQAPAGQRNRWIQTNPGKGWFAYFRIYGPQSPAFDGTWKPGDFVALEQQASTPSP
jgi:hypothetical protein